MRAEQLENYKKWFENYSNSFYGDDEYVNANLKLKQCHTIRVCEEMRDLAKAIGLGDSKSLIAETVALFHDVGRFSQFVKYRTFSDHLSENHCLLSSKVLQDNKVLSELDAGEQQLILTAIEMHGLKNLPTDLNGELELFANLIRDADKVDIFYVALKNYREYKDCPEGFVYEVPEPESEKCSQEIIRKLFNNEAIDYKEVRTINDVKLLQLGWVFDVNFIHSLERIRQRRFILQLLALLPREPEIARVGNHICKYLDSRIEQED